MTCRKYVAAILVLVFALTFTGCKAEIDQNDITGTWNGYGIEWYYWEDEFLGDWAYGVVELKADNTFTVSREITGLYSASITVPIFKGTYTAGNYNINMTTTHWARSLFRLGNYQGFNVEWYTKQQMEEAIADPDYEYYDFFDEDDLDKMYSTGTGTYEMEGTSLILEINDMTSYLTKK